MATPPLSVNKFRLIFIGFWLGCPLIQLKVFHELGFSWNIVITDSLVTGILVAVACVLVSLNLSYYQPEKNKYFFVLFLSGVLALLAVLIDKWILQGVFAARKDYISFLGKSMLIRFFISFLVIGWMAMISVIWYNMEEQRESEDRAAAMEETAKEAELYKLRQQLQPHFLFNSLNSISALTLSRPEEAREMIQKLSDFLRGTLKKDEHQWIPLTEELQYLQWYLDIEKVRFGHRLSAAIEQGEGTNEMMIPAMILQPLVENAIKFGLYDTTDDVCILIRAYREAQQLLISVRNPFDASTSQPSGTGFGLNSVRRRLYLLFARQDLLETHADNNLFTVIIKIPQQHDQISHH